jgi:phospholipase/carboxylesterase
MSGSHPDHAAVIVETGKNPNRSVIWLHGLGADGHDFEPIVPELLRPGFPAIRFIFPHAPVQPVSINGGMAMRAWYDLYGADLAAREDETGILASVKLVHGLLDRERDAGVRSEHLLLAGFSQGGAITLAAGLRYGHSLGGLIALSTYLPLRAQAAETMHTANLKTPVFMGHGSHDAVVPERLGSLSRDRLRELGMNVSWTSYRGMGHSVSAEELRDLSSFFMQWIER